MPSNKDTLANPVRLYVCVAAVTEKLSNASAKDLPPTANGARTVTSRLTNSPSLITRPGVTEPSFSVRPKVPVMVNASPTVTKTEPDIPKV